MSEKKIVVPQGMLNSAEVAWDHFGGIGVDNHLKVALEAALRWLSENPIVPPRDTFNALSSAERDMAEAACVDWQKRMFLAPRGFEGWKIVGPDRMARDITEHDISKTVENLMREWPSKIPVDEFGDRMNDLTVEVNRLGMSAAIEILQRTR